MQRVIRPEAWLLLSLLLASINELRRARHRRLDGEIQLLRAKREADTPKHQ
jgi:hypothetical protein